MSIPPARLNIASIENLLGGHAFQTLLMAGFTVAGVSFVNSAFN
jgi:hypothetical protein